MDLWTFRMELWALTYITPEGIHSFIECVTPEEVEEEIRGMVKRGYNVAYMRVYEPNAGVPITQFMQL